MPSKQLSKITRQSQIQDAIAAIVKEIPSGTHLTASEMHSRAQEIGLSVSLSTVYRILNNLQDQGNVMPLTGERARRYESSEQGQEHDHLICVKCKLTIEFVDDLIKGFGKTVAQRKGFEHKSSRFDILGLCSNCQEQDEEDEIPPAVDYLSRSILEAQEAIALCKAAVISHEARRTVKANKSASAALTRLIDAVNYLKKALVD